MVTLHFYSLFFSFFLFFFFGGQLDKLCFSGSHPFNYIYIHVLPCECLNCNVCISCNFWENKLLLLLLLLLLRAPHWGQISSLGNDFRDEFPSKPSLSCLSYSKTLAYILCVRMYHQRAFPDEIETKLITIEIDIRFHAQIDCTPVRPWILA